MKSVAASQFKATCLKLMEEVRRTGKPVLITKRGKPLVQVVPPPPPSGKLSWLGAMAGTAVLHDDLIEPAVDPSEWEVLKK